MVVAVFSIIAPNAHGNEASQLLNQFGSQCPRTNGGSAKAAAADLGNRLKENFKSLKEDPACADITSNILSLSTLTQELAQFEQQREFDKTKLENEEFVSLYTNYLLDPDFLPIQDTLLNNIIDAQTQIVASNATSELYSDYNDRNLALQTANQIENVLDAFNSAPQCFDSKKSVITKTLGQTLQLLSLYAAPGSAVGYAAASVVVDSFNKFFTNRRFVRALRKIDFNDLSGALSCVTEAFNNQYCATDDSLKLLKLRNGKEKKNKILKPYLDGVNLIDKHIDYNLRDFLLRVYAGGEYTSDGNYFDRRKPIRQLFHLDEKRTSFEKEINVRRPEVNSVFDTGKQGDINFTVASIVSELANQIYNGCRFIENCNGGFTRNPFNEEGFDGNFFKFKLFDFSLQSVPTCLLEGSNNAQPCPSILEYINSKKIVVTRETYNTAISNGNAILNATQKRLEALRQITNSENIYSDLNSADAPSNTRAKSALQSLRDVESLGDRIADYFEDLLNEGRVDDKDIISYQNFGYEARETARLTGEVVKMMDRRGVGIPLYLTEGCNAPENDESFKKLSDGEKVIFKLSPEQKAPYIANCIIRLFKLDIRQTEYLFSRIRAMVLYELQARRKLGEFSEDINDILNAGQSNILSDILGTYGTDTSLNTIYRRLNLAKEDLSDYFEVFYDLYKNRFRQVIKHKELRPFKKNTLCFAALSLPFNKKDRLLQDVIKTCKNEVFSSWHYEIEDLNWMEAMKKPLEERKCLLYRFDRKEKVLDNTKNL